ncbi:MAG: arginine--tRNA ligase, partial [Clostridia bacterium]|nr:arginine--tRNA ligase [Clostridia bacterium]
EHLGFGTMNGADGKPFKTRDGGVMQLNTLLETAHVKSRENIDDSKFSTDAERDDVADKIAIACIKFGDLINNRSKDYIFDIDRFLSNEGKTGAYLLYTITRITSLLKKAEGAIPSVCDPECELSGSERDLMLSIIDSAESFGHAVTERAPNYVAESAYQIATAFSAFYHENHVLGEENERIRQNRLALCAITKAKLCFLIGLLGMDTVEAM